MKRGNKGVIQIIVTVGLGLIIVGFLWIVFTAPLSSVIEKGIAGLWFDDDILGTVIFLRVMAQVLPLLAGLSFMIYGWVSTVEERETGVSSI